MFYREILLTEEHRRQYDEICGQFAEFARDCVQFLVKYFHIAAKASVKTGEVCHATVILLTRHVIEYLDGISVLVNKGCSAPSIPLLRSALEATLGVRYIFETDTKRRALAYQVVHTYKRIKRYEELDPTTDKGKRLRSYLGDDVSQEHFRNLPLYNYPKMIAELRGLLSSAEYAPVEAEYQALNKKKRNFPWYNLFGGPQDCRELAKHLDWPDIYEFCYTTWSDDIHAGSAMKAAGERDGEQVVKPIRHPEGMQQALVQISAFSTILVRLLLDQYAPAEVPAMKQHYLHSLQKRAQELRGRNIIHSPWQDDNLPRL